METDTNTTQDPSVPTISEPAPQPQVEILEAPQQTAPPPESVENRPVPRLWGFATLFFVFAASAVFTTAYLSGTQPVAQPALAASAIAVETIPPPSPAAFNGITLTAKSAIVVDITTNTAIFEKEPDIQWPLASLTKVPLTLAVIEVLEPDEIVVIPYDTKPIGAPSRLPQNSRWRAQDLIDLTLAASSNEGADILAAAADDELRMRYPQAPQGGAAVWRMNSITRQIKLPHTYFLNPTGLDESSTQSGAYGTARDMATLFAYAASSSPSRFAATARPSVAITSLEGETATANNTDEALDAIPRLILGKTGYTDLAGGNLAIVFRTSAGHVMAAVVLGSTQQGRFTDMKALVQAAEESTQPAESLNSFQ